MNKSLTAFRSKFDNVAYSARKFSARVATGGTALLASGAAFAGGSPGSAIAGELAGGKADVMLVIAAAAIIIGVLVLWKYVKRSG